MLKKIVSGGQTGVDRAALDIALQHRIACGGWCPRGRLAEDGPIAQHYPLQETPSESYARRTRWNVRDSDGTLILSPLPLTGGTALTLSHAEKLGRPAIVVDLSESPTVDPTIDWLHHNAIQTVNVAGPRASTWVDAHSEASKFLTALFKALGDAGLIQTANQALNK